MEITLEKHLLLLVNMHTLVSSILNNILYFIIDMFYSLSSFCPYWLNKLTKLIHHFILSNINYQKNFTNILMTLPIPEAFTI